MRLQDAVGLICGGDVVAAIQVHDEEDLRRVAWAVIAEAMALGAVVCA